MKPKSWSIEYQVREDAESMFVPTELLPNAQAGDYVEITSVQPSVSRRGRVDGPAGADSTGDFLRITFSEAT